MSDIKIQPSATGSATVTLTAPATGTARTVTLPDGTGSLIADNGSGKVGIGTSSPARPLEVKDSSDQANIRLQGSVGYCDLSGNGGNGSDFVVLTEGTEKFRVKESGGIRATDGILFGTDTAAANALDDYEEGSGNNSVIAVKLGSTALTVSGVGYKYTKIGNVVHFQFEFRITNLNGASSGAFTVGLPFTAVNGGYATGALRIYNGVVDGNEFVHSDSNNNLLFLSRNRNNNSTANVTATNNAYYFGQLTYITT